MNTIHTFVYSSKIVINDKNQIKKKVKISTSNNKLTIITNNDDLLYLSERPKLRKSPTQLNLIDNNNLIEYKIVKEDDGNIYKIIWITFFDGYGFFSKEKVYNF